MKRNKDFFTHFNTTLVCLDQPLDNAAAHFFREGLFDKVLNTNDYLDELDDTFSYMCKKEENLVDVYK